MARRSMAWNRLAGAIEEEGSALSLLERVESDSPDRLFTVDERQFTLDQLEEQVHSWEREGVRVVTARPW